MSPDPTSHEVAILDASSRPSPVHTLQYLALLYLFATGPTAFQIFIPALPSFAQDFAVPPAVITLAVSLPLLSFAAATLLYGSLSDRIGRRKVLLFGLVLLMLGSAAGALASDMAMVIAARVIQTVGGAATVVVSRALVLDLYRDRSSAAKAMAGLLAAGMIAPIVATPVGGLLADYFGWRANFAAIGALAFGAVLLLLLLPRDAELSQVKGPRRNWWADYAVLLRTPAFLGFAGQASFAMASNTVFLACAPLVMAQGFGIDSTGIGLLLAIGAFGFAAGSILTRWMPDSVALYSRVVVGSSVAVAFAFLGVGLAVGGYWNVWALVLPAAAISLAQGVTSAAAQAGAMSSVQGLAGTASGAMIFSSQILTAIAVQVAASITHSAPTPVLATMAILCAASLACLGMIRTR